MTSSLINASGTNAVCIWGYFDENDSTKYVELRRFLNFSQKPTHATDYYAEWVIANGGKPPKRGDRMSPRRFVGKRFLVQVANPSKDRKGRRRTGGLAHSIVGAIRELLPGKEEP